MIEKEKKKKMLFLIIIPLHKHPPNSKIKSLAMNQLKKDENFSKKYSTIKQTNKKSIPKE